MPEPSDWLPPGARPPRPEPLKGKPASASTVKQFAAVVAFSVMVVFLAGLGLRQLFGDDEPSPIGSAILSSSAMPATGYTSNPARPTATFAPPATIAPPPAATTVVPTRIEGSDRIYRSVVARNRCEDAIRSQLRSPSSAEFVDGVTKDDGALVPTFVVTGQVDAMNAFGATVRQSWTCRARSDFADRDLVYLSETFLI